MNTPFDDIVQQAEALLIQEKYAQAAVLFQQAVHIDSENAEIWAKLSSCLAKQELYDQAFEAASRALSLDSRCHRALRAMFLIYADQKKYNEAKSYAEQAMQFEPRNWKSHDLFRLLYSLQHEYEAARNYSRAALALCPEDDPEIAICYRGAAWIEEKLQNYADAQALINKGLTFAPKSWNLYYQMHWIYRDQQKYAEALEVVKKVMELCPKDHPKLYQYEWDCGWLLHQLKKYDEALARIDRAIALKENEYIIHYLRGLINNDLKQYAEAFKDFSRAIRFSQGSTPDYVYYQRAWIGFYQLKQTAQSMADINRAVEIDPQNADNFALRGAIFQEMKDTTAALRDYSRAIELNPKEAFSIRSRLSIYTQLQNYEGILLDMLRLHRLAFITKRTGQKPHYHYWQDTVYYHLTNLAPQLTSAGETIANYYPCYLAWGERKEVDVHWSGSSHYAHTWRHGTGGAGYMLVTDRNVRIFSFGAIVRHYPLKGSSNFLKAWFLNDLEGDDPNDRSWTIPNQTILGAQIEDGFINLVTTAMKWKVYNHFTSDLNEMCTALNMAMLGKLQLPAAKLPVKEQKPAAEKKPEKAEVLELLKKLGELRDAGVLSEAEFDKKKQELLARL